MKIAFLFRYYSVPLLSNAIPFRRSKTGFLNPIIFVPQIIKKIKNHTTSSQKNISPEKLSDDDKKMSNDKIQAQINAIFALLMFVNRVFQQCFMWKNKLKYLDNKLSLKLANIESDFIKNYVHQFNQSLHPKLN